MPTDVRTSELVINKLSKQQYENIQNPSDTELYLVPEDEEHKPICYPTTASEVKTASMIVKSSVSDNGKILTENGFVYNTSGNPTVSDTKVICDLGVGQFEKKLENLTINTEYHIKSYGQNNSGISYGSELVQMTINNPIPVEYQLVDYLESSGTQYIKTIYTPNINHTITSVMAVTSGASNGYSGCSNVNSRCFWGILATAGLIIANSSGSWAYLSLPFNAIKRTFVLSPTVVSIDSTTTANYNTYPNLPIYLFSRNNNNTASDYAYFKLESFIVTDENNDYVVRMYPVYRVADNKPGMYDIVNNVFYTNQGTGEFTVGPDKEWDE